MEFDRILEKTKRKIQLADLPENFIGVIENVVLKDDARGRECWYVTITLPNGTSVTQKYTDFHIIDLVGALKAMGFINFNEVRGKNFHWSKKHYRIGNPRWIPTKLVEKVKKSSPNEA